MSSKDYKCGRIDLYAWIGEGTMNLKSFISANFRTNSNFKHNFKLYSKNNQVIPVKMHIGVLFQRSKKEINALI